MNVVIYPYSIEHSYIKKYKKLFRYNIIYFMCYGNILPISHPVSYTHLDVYKRQIVKGYENGTREIYVADENGPRKLTKDEELSNLDVAYKKTVDDFVTMETTNQHARGIIGEEMNKISKITSRSALASDYIGEQKTKGKDEIPENLTEKMYGAITSFKEKYTMIHHNQNQLSQLLMSVKI